MMNVYDAVTMQNISTSEKYNRLLNKRLCAALLRKNTVIVKNSEIIDVIIISNTEGYNEIKYLQEVEAENRKTNDRNIFMDTLIKCHNKNNRQKYIEVHLSSKQQLLRDVYKKGTESYFNNMYLHGVEYFQTAVKYFEKDPYPDEFQLEDYTVLAVKYAEALCSVALNNYASLQHAVEIYSSLISEYGTRFPALYYSLAQAYFKLDYYQKCNVVLNEGITELAKCEQLIELIWPGSNKVMSDTEISTLNKKFTALKNECKISRLADAVCSYSSCSSDSKFMYFKGLSFFGYVHVRCSEDCHFDYHISCWKSKLKTSCYKHINNFINSECETNACGGRINCITMFDETLAIKFKYDTSKEKLPKEDKRDHTSKAKKLTTTQSENFKDTTTFSTNNKSVPKEIDKPTQAKNETTHENHIQSKLNPNSIEFYPSNMSSNAEEVLQNKCNSDIKHIYPAASVLETESSKSTTEQNNEIQFTNITKSTQTSIINQSVMKRMHNQNTQATDRSTHVLESLRRENVLLYKSLYAAEEEYNLLISKYKILENSIHFSSSHKDNCKRTESSTQTMNSVVDVSMNTPPDGLANKVNQLRYLNDKLMSECEELRYTLSVQQKVFSETADKYKDENELLKKRILDLEAQFHTEQKNTSSENDIVKKLSKILTNQVEYTHNILIAYMAMYQMKSSGMLWEMENARLWVNDETMPTSLQLEENIELWKIAQNESVQQYYTILNCYGDIIRKIDAQEWESLQTVNRMPDLLKEPPNLLITCFRAILSRNKQLENDVLKYRHIFYNTTPRFNSITYPQTRIPNNVLNISNQPQQQHHHVDPAQSLSLNDAIQNTTILKEVKEEKQNVYSVSNSDTQLDSLSSDNSSEDTATEKTLQSYCSSKGAIPKTYTNTERTEKERRTFESFLGYVNTKEQSSHKKSDVVGMDALLGRLMKYFPLTSEKVVAEALVKVRERNGGLTGSNFKKIIQDVMKVIQTGKQQESAEAPPPPAWLPFNNDKGKWNNSSCTICFEYMDGRSAVQLTCQHVFHAACIKQWLDNNSVCPICRALTIFHEHFPPL